MARISNFLSSLSPKRWLAAAIIPALTLGLVLFNPDPTFAASGGRIGGGSFRAPSMPRTGGYGGGGYRGSYGGYGGGYRGGGMGFPFIVPIFGFGGGGLFGFLILMAIAGVIANSIRGGISTSTSNSTAINERSPGQVTMIQLQLGLLASAKALQEDLRKIAANADTGTPSGLQKVLQETTLSLLRQPDLWVYANVETGRVPFFSAESTFNRLSMTERSKLSAEITSNVSGQRSSNEISKTPSGEADATNEYIAATLLVASRQQLKLSESNNISDLQDNLRILGSLAATDLIALEVIWQPEGQGEVLTAEELVTAYPNLKHL